MSATNKATSATNRTRCRESSDAVNYFAAKKSRNCRQIKRETFSKPAEKCIPYSRKRKKIAKQDRNIESVILGDLRFLACYSSWYPKEFIGNEDRVIKELYVCPRCFAYSRGENAREIRAWIKHWQSCRNSTIPGEKIYVHGEWVDQSDNVCEKNTGTWSIWEVDGAIETLFCQNLSLFAKLFLENKSVFFDLSGFKFFLLVYSPPVTSVLNHTGSNPQIIGYFSKEKRSWDNNNLACILIFPPWQHKGLGSLLIGMSYAISQREKSIGGPERPISELGMKGYRRYWGREIARFLLNQDVDPEQYVDIETISRGTWISPDDCLTMMKEMNIIEYNNSIRRTSSQESGAQKDSSIGKHEGVQDEKRSVFLDKQRVRDWVLREGLKLDKVISEKGFRPGYALNPFLNWSVNVTAGINQEAVISG